jgi:hypothetical protein
MKQTRPGNSTLRVGAGVTLRGGAGGQSMHRCRKGIVLISEMMI